MRRKSDEHLSYIKEKQGEFFADFQTLSPKKPKYFSRQDIAIGKKVIFNLSYENLVLFSIIFIMLLVVFFSLGVEKGKRIALQGNKDKTARYVDNIIEKKPLSEKIPNEKRKDETAVLEKGESNELEIEKKSNAIYEGGMADASIKPYTIQVVAFKNVENAKKEIQRLKREGYDAFLIPSKEWTQVCVGRYITREETKKDLDSLKKMYLASYVRKVGR